ncbi:MAG: helix-turn-helix domain-containing protein [Hyphomicrobiaceae bacterium]
MAAAGLREVLHRLGLKQTEFARLLDVSPRTVSLWATGETVLPGPVHAYLRLLPKLTADVLAEELNSVKGRSKMLDEGLYNVEYWPNQAKQGESGSALAVLRNGKILGSDRFGGVFVGSYQFDAAKEVNAVHLRMHVPPEGVLVTGFAAGSDGATVDIVGSFARAAPVTRARAEVAGRAVEVQMTYLGPLPN